MAKHKVAIIGKGRVGSAIQKGLQRAGHEVRAVGKDPRGVAESARWGDVVVFATPYSAYDEVLRDIGDAAAGKVIIDVSNALTKEMKPALLMTTSAGEELQKKAPRAKVVKAFNSVFGTHMDSGQIKGEKLALLVAGNDGGAKETVAALGRDIGFDPVDAGPIENARWLEALGYLNIQLGLVLKLGTDIGFKLVR